MTSCKTCFNAFVFKYHGMVYHIKTKKKENERKGKEVFVYESMADRFDGKAGNIRSLFIAL